MAHIALVIAHCCTPDDPHNLTLLLWTFFPGFGHRTFFVTLLGFFVRLHGSFICILSLFICLFHHSFSLFCFCFAWRLVSFVHWLFVVHATLRYQSKRPCLRSPIDFFPVIADFRLTDESALPLSSVKCLKFPALIDTVHRMFWFLLKNYQIHTNFFEVVDVTGDLTFCECHDAHWVWLILFLWAHWCSFRPSLNVWLFAPEAYTITRQFFTWWLLNITQ